MGTSLQFSLRIARASYGVSVSFLPVLRGRKPAKDGYFPALLKSMV
jgi:hypothetical protein